MAQDGAGTKLPSFLDGNRLADLEAARAALQSRIETSETTLVRFDRAETAKLISTASETQRRAEEERLLSAEVRARAEALSQRFSIEAAAAETAVQPKPVAATVAATVTKASATAVANAKGVEPRTAAAMQRAAEALVRARRDLEEATRRAEAASHTRGSPSWQNAKVEIEEARRRATEAVDQAQKAIDEQKATAEVVANAPEATPAIGTAERPRDPRMVPPYALGAAAR